MRWLFADPVTVTSYEVPINPNRMTSPHLKQNTQVGWVGVDGRSFSRRGQRGPTDWSFSGFLKTEAQLDTFLDWFNVGNVIHITDHYSRTWAVVLVEFSPLERQRTIRSAEGYTYDMRAYILERIS